MFNTGKRKKVIVLGSTGSIGINALEVIDHFRDSFEVTGLSAHTDENRLLYQADKYNANALVLSGKSPVTDRIRYHGEEGIINLLKDTEADIVVNGIAGAAGLLPSLVSLETGKNLALANKESIVMAANLLKKTAADKRVSLIPVDSEHSALFQLIEARNGKDICEIIITASGGAFRDMPADRLSSVKPLDAAKHPNWSMGEKITIDSATMANKGLEVIEAHYLFDISLSSIKVLVHPQSMVHSLIRTSDNSMYAQISSPDMRVPIQNALTWPDVVSSPFGMLDLDGLSLDFKRPDLTKYPMLSLAYRAAETGQGAGIAYNAANEEAVSAFTAGIIKFTDIPLITEKTLDRDWSREIDYVEDILREDKKARYLARRYLEEFEINK